MTDFERAEIKKRIAWIDQFLEQAQTQGTIQDMITTQLARKADLQAQLQAKPCTCGLGVTLEYKCAGGTVEEVQCVCQSQTFFVSLTR
jgi:hypothetical protein